MQWVAPIKDKKTIKKLNQEILKEEPQVVLCYLLSVKAGISQYNALQLHVQDVIDKDELIIRAGKKNTAYPLPEEIRGKIKDYIGTHLSEAGLSSFLIPDSFSVPDIPYKSSAMTRRINAAGKRAGILSFGAQTPRKTFLFKLYDETGDIGLVQKYINAASANIAYRYLGVLPGTEEKYKRRGIQENENSRYKLLSDGNGIKRIDNVILFLRTLADDIDDPINTDAVYGKIDITIGLLEKCIEKYLKAL